MKFPYLLFDADDTLFDFPKAAARAFSAMCRSNGVPDTLDTRALYHRINQELWAAFDRGEVSKDYVTLERFVRFFQALKLPRDPDKCNRDYLTALGAGVYPLPHAEAVCRELVRRGHKLYIVTNAVASVQRSRLQGSVFADLITDAFISEDAGASKPDPAYYAYVRSRIPGLTPENKLQNQNSHTTPHTHNQNKNTAPTMPDFPAAGTILLERPGQRTCGSTMRSGTCGSCWILSESTLSCLNLKNPGECPPRRLTGIISSSKLRVAIRNNKRPDPSGLLPFLSAQERAWPGAPLTATPSPAVHPSWPGSSALLPRPGSACPDRGLRRHSG